MSSDPALVSPAAAPRVRLLADAAVITLVGPVDAATTDSCRCSLEQALEARPSVVVADLTRAELVLESIALLTEVHHLVTEAGARFAVAGPSGPDRDVSARLKVTPPVLI